MRNRAILLIIVMGTIMFSWSYVAAQSSGNNDTLNLSSTPNKAWKGNSVVLSREVLPYNYYVGIGTGVALASGVLGREVITLFSTYGFKSSPTTSVEFGLQYAQVNAEGRASSGLFGATSLTTWYSDVIVSWIPFASTPQFHIGLGPSVNIASVGITVRTRIFGTTLDETSLSYQHFVALGGCAKIDWDVYQNKTVDVVLRAQGNIYTAPFIGADEINTFETPPITLSIGVLLRAKW